MHPRVIFLDWDGTLSLIRFWGHWRQTRPADWAIIQTRLFQQNRPLIYAWMRGQYCAEDVIDRLASFLHPPGANLLHPEGASAQEWSAEELLTELQQSCEAATFADPAIPDSITRLRDRGHLVVIATDNMDTFRRWTIPAMGLDNQFDAILSSHELGVLKNDVAPNGSLSFFADFLAHHNLRPADCLMIDDSRSLQPLAEANEFNYRLVTVLCTLPSSICESYWG